MKHHLLKRLALPFAFSLLLAGCSADNIVSEPEKPVEKDTDFFINVKIASPAETDTRADDDNTNLSAKDYTNGTAAEQKIHNILFVFYNSDYEYVGNSTYTPTSQTEQTADGSVETIMTITVPVKVAAGSTKPAYVMAYVNPTRKAQNDLFTNFFSALGAFRTLDDVREISSGEKKHNGFAMNNSVYYTEDDEGKITSTLPEIAVPIDGDKLFQTVEDAQKASDDSSVIIYVERIVAKVTLDQEKDNFTQEDNKVENEEGKKYTLNFNVLGWGLSNLEKYTFLVKNFRNSAAGNPKFFENLMEFNNYEYDKLNKNLTKERNTANLTNPSWNFSGKNMTQSGANWGISGHRSFWALSPTYYYNGVQIPTYADDLYYSNENLYKPYLHEDEYNLIYRSFNDIYKTNETVGIGTHGMKVGDTQYTLEHTMQESQITDYQKRAVTCALVAGQYSITDEDGKQVNYDNFYLRKRMTETGPAYTIYINDEEILKAFFNANSTIYLQKIVNGEINYEPVKYSTEYLNDFEIIHPREDILGTDNDGNNIKIASRYVTLRLKQSGIGKYYAMNTAGVMTLIDQENIEKINQDLYTNLIGMLGGIEEYYKGYAYFEIPVKHLWGRNAPGIGDPDFNAQLGQYGIVRNHSYNIKMLGIKGIGIGLSDPDAPIVPNVDNDNYVVKTEIRVQRWRVVPIQEVYLKP